MLLAPQLRDALRKLEALAGIGKATQLKALAEREALAAESSTRVLLRRAELLRSGSPVAVRVCNPSASA